MPRSGQSTRLRSADGTVYREDIQVATPAQWLEGARPRTLPAAVAPVAAGTGAAYALDGGNPLRAVLALVVAMALQIGVNYANDYSDGIRGTDADRVGPLRLTGSAAAAPAAVKRAAFSSFGVGAVAGAVLVALSGQWWLLAVGAAAVLAAWFYTGGKHPVRLSPDWARSSSSSSSAWLRSSARRTRKPAASARPPWPLRSPWVRWRARSSSPTTCATSRPTPRPASAHSRCGWATAPAAGSTSLW